MPTGGCRRPGRASAARTPGESEELVGKSSGDPGGGSLDPARSRLTATRGAPAEQRRGSRHLEKRQG